jgi:hypothetical protein
MPAPAGGMPVPADRKPAPAVDVVRSRSLTQEEVRVSGSSISEMLARLEEQVAHNAEREAFHAGREAFHRGQRGSYAEELARLTQTRDSLKAAAEAAEELMGRVAPKAPEPPRLEMPDMGKRFRLARLVELVVERKEPRERFGPRAIAAEVNQTFADHLRRPCTERQVSVALTWLAKSGRIVRHQKSGPFMKGSMRGVGDRCETAVSTRPLVRGCQALSGGRSREPGLGIEPPLPRIGETIQQRCR